MTFLAPAFLAAAAVAAAGIVALHLLARLRPRVALFPTARFVSQRTAHAPARAARPSDLLLLAVRALAVLLVGAAFARPQVRPATRPVARVVVVDISRTVASIAEVRDSASALLADGDVLVAFDSSARAIAGAAVESLATMRRTNAPGSLSVALVAAARAAGSLRQRATSLELVVISPFVTESWDAATSAIRAQWSGRARLVRVAARADTLRGPNSITARASGDDPVRASLMLLGRLGGDTPVRIVRTSADPSDSAWAVASGGVVVNWPADPAGSHLPARPAVDTAGAVIAGGSAVVAPFERAVSPGDGRVIARWVDGEAAAVERTLGDGCVRDVAVAVPLAGDLALRESFRRLVATVTLPCGGLKRPTPLADSSLVTLRGGHRLLESRRLAPDSIPGSRLAAWLLAAALLLLAVELLVRRAAAAEREAR